MQKAYKSALTKSLGDVKKHVANIKAEAQQCLVSMKFSGANFLIQRESEYFLSHAA